MAVLWRVIKGLLSLLLLALAVGAIVQSTSPASLGIAGLLLFLAALPWVNFAAPSRAIGLVGIVFSFALFAVAFRSLSDERFPLECEGRRQFFCLVENFLYSIGGKYLVAVPWLVLAGIVLAVSASVVVRTTRSLK